MTRTERKEKAQNIILQYAAYAVLAELESYGGPDLELVREIGKQTQRVMKLYKIYGLHGLPNVDQDLDEWINGL